MEVFPPTPVVEHNIATYGLGQVSDDVEILSIFVNGLALSGIYILVALGLCLLLSILNVLNFAHGAIGMISGYICYQFAMVFGLNQWLSLLLSALVIAALGIFLEKFCFRPFYGDFFRTVVVAIAIALILTTTVNLFLGTDVRALHPFVPGMVSTGGIRLSAAKLAASIIAAILLLAMMWFVRSTKPGLQMLAIAQDKEGAVLQGISVNRISALAFALGCALATVAVGFFGSIYTITPIIGDFMLVKAIQLVILGGIGSIGGVFVGGVLIGFADSVLPLFSSGDFAQVIGLGIIIVVLVFRPQGFFGREM